MYWCLCTAKELCAKKCQHEIPSVIVPKHNGTNMTQNNIIVLKNSSTISTDVINVTMIFVLMGFIVIYIFFMGLLLKSASNYPQRTWVMPWAYNLFNKGKLNNWTTILKKYYATISHVNEISEITLKTLCITPNDYGWNRVLEELMLHVAYYWAHNVTRKWYFGI